MAAVLDAFASKLADVLVGMAKEEVEMLLGVPGEITKLETTLGDLSRILADAERKRIRDFAAEGWARELKDVMYDADDILDLCQIMDGREDPSSPVYAPKSTSGCWNIPKMFFCFRNPVVAHEIGRKIQALNQRLEDLEKRSSRFKFITQEINHSGPYTINNASNLLTDKTGSLIIQSDVVGDKIMEDTKKIVDLLIKKVVGTTESKSNNVVVGVAITGMGGIGKTTLARMVFNDSTVKESFHQRIWLSVNKEVNEISVLQSVLTSFGANHEGFSGNKDLLERALKDTVQQKKFLLVMDDVWSEKVWNEMLRVPLSYGSLGSRILVTTRNDEVACGMNAQHLHRVDTLQTEDAWVLLKKQVVLNESDEGDVDRLKGIGIKIVENCGCLPLAVKVLGGVLRHKSRRKDTWTNILNSHTWSKEGMDGDVNKAVYLSYEDLPSHLKQCFVYCSLFPKGELIRMGDIVALWISQGYIQDKMNSMALEDLGEEYYKDLVSRNLLEPEESHYSNSACIMHDVIHSCARYIMKDEGELISESQDASRILMSSLKLRHLSISNKAVMIDSLKTQASLRTLMFFGSTMVDLKDFLNYLSCLRVLYLDNVNVVELPDSICDLKHLRHLCLAYTSISKIPQDIGDLKFLQALDLGWCRNVSQLPNSITKLQRLRLLNLKGTDITSVPRGFGKLEDLVIMSGFPTHSIDNTDGWCSLEELGPLSKLRILEIEGLEKASSGSMAAKAMLSDKHHLRELDLSFTSKFEENGEVIEISEAEHQRTEEVLANLRPPACIEQLGIKGYFARGLPQWMRIMSNFESLTWLGLADYACCTQLPYGLGQLPFLDCFLINHAPSIKHIGHELLHPSLGGDGDGKDGTSGSIGARSMMKQPHRISQGSAVAFPKLVKLCFWGMTEWIEWEWQQHVAAMPALKELFVSNCKLQRLPPGLSYHALGLRELDLKNNRCLVSVENFPSLVKLWSYNNPRIERISNNPSLQWIDITNCPTLKELHSLPSLQSLEWWDLKAEALPQYLRETKLNKLRMNCSPSLLKLIALQDDSSEWGKIKHVQQVKAYGRTLDGDEDGSHIYYNKEPYSFEVESPQTFSQDGDEEEENEMSEELGEPTDGDEEEEKEMSEELGESAGGGEAEENETE